VSNEIRVYRFAPDQPGRGGVTTGLHSFLGVEDTRNVDGVRPENKMWMRDASYVRHIANVTGPGGTVKTVLGFIDWYRYAQGGTSTSNEQVFAEGYVYNGTAYVNFRLPNMSVVYPNVVGAGQQVGGVITNASMLPVKDRLFLATGFDQAQIWNGSKSGSSADGVVPVGVPSPTVAPTLTVSYNYSSESYWYGVKDAYTFAIGSQTDVTYLAMSVGGTVRLSHEQLDGGSVYFFRTIEKIENGYTSGARPYSGPFKFDADVVLISKAANSDIINFSEPFPADGDEDESATGIVGLGFTYGGVTYQILLAVNQPLVAGGEPIGRIKISQVVAAEWVETPSWRLSGTRITVTEPIAISNHEYNNSQRRVVTPLGGAGYSSWEGPEAPGYAYAYYDPLTGHMSNLSPVGYAPSTRVVNGMISISTRQKTGVNYANSEAPSGVTTSSTGIQYLGTPSGPAVTRFTHILWFRTRKSGGGAMLYPIGGLTVNGTDWYGKTGKASDAAATFTDDTTDDKLLVSGRVRAPLITNHPPRVVLENGAIYPIAPRGMAWWDGRLWMFGTPDMGALHYSCDQAQVGLGRSEESFPDTNRLVVPAGDSEITSILTVGEYLLVNTTRYSYVVQGNHERNYRLVRIATELGGIRKEAICEIPVGGDGNGMFAAVTTDRRVLVGSVGGQLDDIGAPIRNWLGGTVWGTAFYRADGHPRLVISVNDRSGSSWQRMLEYNFDHKIWTANRPGITGNDYTNTEAITVIQRSGPAAWPTGAGGAKQYDSFLMVGFSGSLYYPSVTKTPARGRVRIETWHLPADTGKRRYSFAWARVVLVGGAAADALPYSLYVTANDSESSYVVKYTMSAHTDPARGYFKDSASATDGVSRELVCFAASGVPGAIDGNGTWVQGTATGARPLGYRLRFRLESDPTDLSMYAISFFEVALREESEDGTVEP